MTAVNLNLLPALDALLAEGSVAGAARRLGLNDSAMSRTLARVRAGRNIGARAGLVPFSTQGNRVKEFVVTFRPSLRA